MHDEIVRFASISSFRNRLAVLLKVKRKVYDNVPKEICRSFHGASIEQIRRNRDMILVDNNVVVIKLRMPDKEKHLSKADGYRLIYMALKSVPLVVFLDIYPKRGPMQQLDIDDKELTRLLQMFIEEEQAESLVYHDIEKSLEEVSM